MPKKLSDDTFQNLMRTTELIDVFKSEFSKIQSKGVDRLNGFQFSDRAEEHLDVASRKCLEGNYRFSPYLENLKLKGRGKEPRLVGIPCIRDRVILHQLNKFLATLFPECVSKRANNLVFKISESLNEPQPEAFICSRDIKRFYDSINRECLLNELSKRIRTTEAQALIRHAINTPIVPKNVRRNSYKNYQSGLGIPQGLAISNILAEIYLKTVDKKMSDFLSIKYYRYVDDVLMYGNKDELEKAQEVLVSYLEQKGLKLHSKESDKSHFSPLNKPFSYLGYLFEWPKISVRDSTIERLLQSFAAKFSDYVHNRTNRLKKFKYLNKQRLTEIFVLELNERITGAISEKRRYGWIAYFSRINDLTLLYKLDSIVSSLFSRLPDFDRKPPSSLKKFVRAYFAMKFNPTSEYIQNYDVINTRAEKMIFLLERGLVGPDDSLTDEEIEERYDRYRKHVLSKMHADEGVQY